MLPCPLWFWYRWASAGFLMVVFTWATYNGATFYIDVFGRRMEKEFEALKKEVAKWQATPEGKHILDDTDPALKAVKSESQVSAHGPSESIESIPLLDSSSRQEQGHNVEAVRRR